MSVIPARLWRAWYRLRWRVVDRRALDRLRVRRVAGIEVVVVPGVLDPDVFFSSEVLIESIRAVVEPGAGVLELGTGCGIGALAAAEVGAAFVLATDVDPTAVRCCRANVELRGLDERIEVRQGDLFEAAQDATFDVVAFNPPYLTGPAAGALDLALRMPVDLPQRFAAGLPDHLAPGGSGLLVLSTNGDPDTWLAALRQARFTMDAVVTRDRGSEVLTAWRITGPAA